MLLLNFKNCKKSIFYKLFIYNDTLKIYYFDHSYVNNDKYIYFTSSYVKK